MLVLLGDVSVSFRSCGLRSTFLVMFRANLLESASSAFIYLEKKITYNSLYVKNTAGHTILSVMYTDSPEAVFSVGWFLVNIGCFPFRFYLVDVSPEVNEEVRDLACRWQEALQVECVVAGEAKTSCRDDGCTKLQTFFCTEREIKNKENVWDRLGGMFSSRLHVHHIATWALFGNVNSVLLYLSGLVWPWKNQHLLDHLERGVGAGGPEHSTSQFAWFLQEKNIWVWVFVCKWWT